MVCPTVPKAGLVLPIKTRSELSMVIAVASALSSMPLEVNAPVCVTAPVNVPPEAGT